MQLYAYNERSELISARQAIKQKNYICAECQNIVRVRGGYHRQNHYYHLKSNNLCTLSGKSMVHIQIQCFLQKLLTEKDCALEHRFNNIGRIADVFWISKNIVFEIQCSPLASEEAVKRTNDYRSIGLTVVWVLHDTQFNQWRVSAAEFALRYSPLYFTNIDIEGKGIIYDQFDTIFQGIRRNVLPPIPVEIYKCHILDSTQREMLLSQNTIAIYPLIIHPRIRRSSLYFSGDLIANCLNSINPSFQSYLDLIAKYTSGYLTSSNKISSKKNLTTFIKKLPLFLTKLYRHIFQILLERACR